MNISELLVVRATRFLPLSELETVRMVCKQWYEWLKRDLLGFAAEAALDRSVPLELRGCKTYEEMYYNLRDYASTGIPNTHRWMSRRIVRPVVIELKQQQFNGCVSVSPNTKWILWYNGEVLQCIRVCRGWVEWDIMSKVDLYGIGCPSVCCSTDKVLLCAGDYVDVYELADGTKVGRLEFPYTSGIRTGHIYMWKYDGYFLVSGSYQVDIYTWKLEKLFSVVHIEKCVVTEMKEPSKDINCCNAGLKMRGEVGEDPLHYWVSASLHIHTWLVGGRELKIWNAQTGKLLGTLKSDADFASVRNSAMHTEWYLLLASDTAGNMTFWKLTNKHCIFVTKLNFSFECTLSIALSSEHLALLMDDPKYSCVLCAYRIDTEVIERLGEREGWSFDLKDEDQTSNDSANSFSEGYTIYPTDHYSLVKDNKYRPWMNAGLPHTHRINQHGGAPHLKEKFIHKGTINEFAIETKRNDNFLTKIYQSKVPWTAYDAEFLDMIGRYVGVWVSKAAPGISFDVASSVLYSYDTQILYPKRADLCNKCAIKQPDLFFTRDEPWSIQTARYDAYVTNYYLNINVDEEGTIAMYGLGTKLTISIDKQIEGEQEFHGKADIYMEQPFRYNWYIFV